jgi:hypothetical protein
MLTNVAMGLVVPFLVVAVALRPVLFHDRDKTRLPGWLSIQLIVLPVVLFGFLATDFVLRRDCGLLLRDRNWPLATTVATLRQDRVVLEFPPRDIPKLLLTPNVRTDVVEFAFKVLTEARIQGSVRFQITNLNPAVDLTFLKGYPPDYAKRIWNWHIVRGTISTVQIQALAWRDRSVEFMGTSFVPTENVPRAVLTRSAKFSGSDEQARDLISCIDLEKSIRQEWLEDRPDVAY